MEARGIKKEGEVPRVSRIGLQGTQSDTRRVTHGSIRQPDGTYLVQLDGALGGSVPRWRWRAIPLDIRQQLVEGDWFAQHRTPVREQGAGKMVPAGGDDHHGDR